MPFIEIKVTPETLNTNITFLFQKFLTILTFNIYGQQAGQQDESSRSHGSCSWGFSSLRVLTAEEMKLWVNERLSWFYIICTERILWCNSALAQCHGRDFPFCSTLHWFFFHKTFPILTKQNKMCESGDAFTFMQQYTEAYSMWMHWLN